MIKIINKSIVNDLIIISNDKWWSITRECRDLESNELENVEI